MSAETAHIKWSEVFFIIVCCLYNQKGGRPYGQHNLSGVYQLAGRPSKWRKFVAPNKLCFIVFFSARIFTLFCVLKLKEMKDKSYFWVLIVYLQDMYSVFWLKLFIFIYIIEIKKTCRHLNFVRNQGLFA